LKEKLLAAKTAGVKTVIVPEKNRADVAELDEEIVGGMEIVYAGDMKQVYKTAFSQEN
jgi:ATP-dependent Lon protease